MAANVSSCAPSSARAADVVTTVCNGFDDDLYNRARTLCESNETIESYEGAHSALYPDRAASPRSTGRAGLRTAALDERRRVFRHQFSGELPHAPDGGMAGGARCRCGFHTLVVLRSAAGHVPLRAHSTNDYGSVRVPGRAFAPVDHLERADGTICKGPDLAAAGSAHLADA